MISPVMKLYKLGDSNFNADLNYELEARVAGLKKGNLTFGTKVIYSGARGSYDIGYYIGASKDGKTAVCLLGGRYGWKPGCVSRVSPGHLFVTDWEDRHVNENENSGRGTIRDALDEIKEQI